jgi:hypothetical protein
VTPSLTICEARTALAVTASPLVLCFGRSGLLDERRTSRIRRPIFETPRRSSRSGPPALGHLAHELYLVITNGLHKSAQRFGDVAVGEGWEVGFEPAFVDAREARLALGPFGAVRELAEGEPDRNEQRLDGPEASARHKRPELAARARRRREPRGRAVRRPLGRRGGGFGRLESEGRREPASPVRDERAGRGTRARGGGAALDRFAPEPSVALAATFFAGSAAGAVSTFVVLSLGWVVVRRLRREAAPTGACSPSRWC